MSDSEEEEIINYSKLLKKGRKDNQVESRQALFQCISDKGTLPKSVSHGTLYSEPPYWTTITINKGTHLHSMGFTHEGKVKLYPEEAAYLVARNALVVDEGVDFERFCEIMYEADDGFINFDKYQVYAYLKRLGFIVMRSKQSHVTESVVKGNSNVDHHHHQSILDRVLQWIYGGGDSKRRRRTRKEGPLIWDYRFREYKSVYSTLRIIPSTSWYQPFSTSSSSLSSLRFKQFDFDVYKPRASWKKKDPGLPDFKVIVSNVHEPIPSLEEQKHLFNQLSSIEINHSNYPPLRNVDTENHVPPTFIMALAADSEGVLFLRMTGTGLADISTTTL